MAQREGTLEHDAGLVGLGQDPERRLESPPDLFLVQGHVVPALQLDGPMGY